MWCWVEALDDESAYMALATSNNQGELSPLEIGIHALNLEKGKNRWTGGALKEYAKAIGKAPAYVTELRNAAEVFRSLDLAQANSKESFKDKAKHLDVAHKLPRSLWPTFSARTKARFAKIYCLRRPARATCRGAASSAQ